MRRIWLRAGGLALLAVAVLVGLTLYFSSEKIPACLVSGASKWKPPAQGTQRYMVVLLNRSVCFFDMSKQRLAGALPLAQAKWVVHAVPPQSDTLTVADQEHGVVYATQRNLLGFRVLNLRTHAAYVVGFEGFTWNRRFGPNPPSHGLSLAPDRPELWVLDAPNSVVHLFDVSGLPSGRPRPLGDIRLSKPLSGDENPCSHACGRLGFLEHSSDGRFVYVGDSGDVIDTQTRQQVANLEALHNSRVYLEVDWVDGKPVFPSRR